MKRMIATLMAAGVLVAGQAGATASGLQAGDRASTPAERSNAMMGMGGDAGMWIMILGLLVIVGVAIEGNNHDEPSSP